MPLCHVQWFSNVLQKQVAMNVLIPSTGTPPFNTYYLLHGLSDDYSSWMRRTRIEVYAEQFEMIIVMPDGFRWFYTDNNEGPAAGKYIAEELPAFIERTFPARTDRAGRCIGGLSMGGYGALRAAFTYPHRYRSANSHSGALLAGSKVYETSDMAERCRIFGADPAGSKHDLIKLAENLKTSGLAAPRVLIDCGTDDKLQSDNLQFHQRLQSLKFDHEYAEYPGGHNWDYWDAHIRQALAFHARDRD